MENLANQYLLFMGAPQNGEGGGNISFLIMLGAIILVMWFFMIRPQRKKEKQQREFRENLKKGDKVVTIGGVHGKIAELKDDVVILSLEEGNKIRVEKNAISMDSSSRLTEDQSGQAQVEGKK